MDLPTLWFVLIAVLWIGYLVLEGFDFGVGILLFGVGRDEGERGQAIRSIAPVWDGNEVWLLVAGGATFAAFPEWYATMFSGFYLALTFILIALIVRVMALEYHDARWRRRWDVAIVASSAAPALLWGVAFGNIVGGSPLDAEGHFAGNFLDLLNPYALLGGLATLSLFALHGAHFLALRTEGAVRERANGFATRLWPVTVAIVAAFAVWTLAGAETVRPLAVFGAAAAAAALIAVFAMHRARREGWAFALTAVAITGAVVLLFATLYPNVMISSGPGPDLTIAAAASTHKTLVAMTVVAVIVTPIVLLYQGWTYWVFRARVSADGVGDIKTPLDLVDRKLQSS
jgi:cytochrome d ubiquinol oxidase subunit II